MIRKKAKNLLFATTILAGFTACQKELQTTELVEAPSNETEIIAKDFHTFDSLVQADPSLILKVKKVDLDRMDQNTTEQAFCEKVKLVHMPLAEAAANNALGARGDIITTLPTITVYGSWPSISWSDWYFSSSIYSFSHDPMGNYTPAMQRVMALKWQKWRDPLYKQTDTKNYLPEFTFDNKGGVLKVAFEKINDNQIKAVVGLNTAKLWYQPGWFTDYIPVARGQVEFTLNKGAGGNFTGANFNVGTGSFTLNGGGSSIDVKSSNLTLSISPQGGLSNIKLATTVGNYSIWAGGNLTNTVNVGLTNTINKTFSTTFQGGYNNGTISAGFSGSYGPLSGQINFAPNFDAGIQIKISY